MLGIRKQNLRSLMSVLAKLVQILAFTTMKAIFFSFHCVVKPGFHFLQEAICKTLALERTEDDGVMKQL